MQPATDWTDVVKRDYEGIGSMKLVTSRRQVQPDHGLEKFDIKIFSLKIFLLSGLIRSCEIELERYFVGLTTGASMCVIFAGAAFFKLSNKETSDLQYNP